MRSQLADYRLLQPFDPDGSAAGSWVAAAPARLGDIGQVIVVELPETDEAAWPGVLSRLRQLAAATSEHVVALLEAGRSEDPPAMAWFSCVRGEARPLPPGQTERRRVLGVLAGAARGAADLHRAGQVHGGIRPETILADGDRGVLDTPAARCALRPPTVIQVRQPADLDGIEPDALWGAGPTATSDVFALGAAAHGLLTGRLLHSGLAADQVVTSVQRVLVERPTVDPGLDGPLAQVIGACLARDPGARPDAATLADRFGDLEASS